MVISLVLAMPSQVSVKSPLIILEKFSYDVEIVSNYGRIMSPTVATLLSSVPSLALYVNESVPTKPAFG